VPASASRPAAVSAKGNTASAPYGSRAVATRARVRASAANSRPLRSRGQRNARTSNAPASALPATISASCADEANSDSDIGSVRIANSHTAAPPAQAIAAAPTATAAVPVSNRDSTSVCTTVIRAARPISTPTAAGT